MNDILYEEFVYVIMNQDGTFYKRTPKGSGGGRTPRFYTLPQVKSIVKHRPHLRVIQYVAEYEGSYSVADFMSEFG